MLIFDGSGSLPAGAGKPDDVLAMKRNVGGHPRVCGDGIEPVAGRVLMREPLSAQGKQPSTSCELAARTGHPHVQEMKSRGEALSARTGHPAHAGNEAIGTWAEYHIGSCCARGEIFGHDSRVCRVVITLRGWKVSVRGQPFLERWMGPRRVRYGNG